MSPKVEPVAVTAKVLGVKWRGKEFVFEMVAVVVVVDNEAEIRETHEVP